MMNQKKVARWAAVAAAIGFLILIATGIAGVVDNRLFYEHAWGGLVFAPMALAFGVFGIGMMILAWVKKWPGNKNVDKKGRSIRTFLDEFPWR